MVGATGRGVEPATRETYQNGVRKITYIDPEGNEIGFGGAPSDRPEPDRELDRVVERELALLDPAVRSDPERVRAFLHPDFTEFGASGRVWDRSSIAEVTSGVDEPITATERTSRWLGPDAVLLTYRSHAGERHALRSSTWIRHDGEWLLLFHQGTPCA